MNILVGKIIEIFHEIFVITMIYGFILPKPFLKYYLLLWPITYIHWQFNNDKCFLTELEYKFKGIKEESPISSKDHNYPFMRKLYSKFNIHLTDEQIHNFIIMKINIFWLIGAVRYLKYVQTGA